MTVQQFSLVEAIPIRKRTRWHVFVASDQFRAPWWAPEASISDSEHWVSAQHEGVELGRCKFVLALQPQHHPTLGAMPHGQLDILALEVARWARNSGVGREMLRAIRNRYPLPRLTALNDSDESRGFWDRVGWIRHEHPSPMLRSERVTYSER
jgi:ribosomal protein S18 acetylase RimI-like enzyme